MSLALGRFDHRERDPVLNRAARIFIFQFQEKVTRPGVDLRDLHQWRIADQRKDRGWLVMRNRRRWRRLDHSKKATRSLARLCATTRTGYLQEIAGAVTSGFRRSLAHNGDLHLCRSRLLESTKPAYRRTV